MRNLVVYMIQSGESLEYVIDGIINGKKFKQPEQEKPAGRSRTPTRGNNRSSVSPGTKNYNENRERIMKEMQSVLTTSDIGSSNNN
jgi:hypothetical protein